MQFGNLLGVKLCLFPPRKLGDGHIQRYGYQVPGEPFLHCEACSAIKKIYIYLERTEKEIQEGNREGEPEAPLSASYFLVCVRPYRSGFPGLVTAFGGW